MTRDITTLSTRIGGLRAPFHDVVRRQPTGRRSHHRRDRRRPVPVPHPGHLASWAGVCPGNHESGGRRKSGKTRKGNHGLTAGLAGDFLRRERRRAITALNKLGYTVTLNPIQTLA
ncbi:transposase [Dactylosporangium sp. CA-233914]|uniref:transposase n=1 Tax=Dactylosporangium sp. CA-233914 TaxID=3239934 RepID=UPI003D9500AC